MHWYLLKRGWTLLCAVLISATLLSGCKWFDPGINDNSEPKLDTTYDEGSDSASKPTQK